MSETETEKAIVFDLEELRYDRDLGFWRGTFLAKTRLTGDFRVEVSIADSIAKSTGGYPQTNPAEVAVLRLREKAHKALQSLVEISAQNLRKSDELLPGASDQ